MKAWLIVSRYGFLLIIKSIDKSNVACKSKSSVKGTYHKWKNHLRLLLVASYQRILNHEQFWITNLSVQSERDWRGTIPLRFRCRMPRGWWWHFRWPWHRGKGWYRASCRTRRTTRRGRRRRRRGRWTRPLSRRRWIAQSENRITKSQAVKSCANYPLTTNEINF